MPRSASQDPGRSRPAGRHEINVGRYYLTRHNYTAAINRFREVLFKYQNTREAEEALERLTEAYLAMGIVDEAQTAAAVLGHNYPEFRMVPGSLRPAEERRPVAAEHRICGFPRRSRRSDWAEPSLLASFQSPLTDETGLHAGPARDSRHRSDRPAGARFRRGLTVLTGETGAGKSILLDAFSLALGGRGDGGLVRPASRRARSSPSSIRRRPSRSPRRAEQGLAIDGDLILRRVQMADGRTRAFVNDQPVSVQALKAIGRELVEIHGQHDDRALMDPAAHRSLADAYGGLEPLVEKTRAAYAEVKRSEKALQEERLALEAARKEADFLHHAHEELSKLNPQPGEEEKLATERAAMMQAEKVVGRFARRARQRVGRRLANLHAVVGPAPARPAPVTGRPRS